MPQSFCMFTFRNRFYDCSFYWSLSVKTNSIPSILLWFFKTSLTICSEIQTVQLFIRNSEMLVKSSQHGFILQSSHASLYRIFGPGVNRPFQTSMKPIDTSSFTRVSFDNTVICCHPRAWIITLVWALTSAVDVLSARFGLADAESSSFGRGGEFWRAGVQQCWALWGQGKNTILSWKKNNTLLTTVNTHTYTH